MKKYRWVLLAWLCVSCFEIKESVSLTEKGGGHYRLLIDFSQSADVVRQVLKATQDPGSNPFEGTPEPIYELSDILDSALLQLSFFKGISNSKKIFDADKLILGYEFDFQKLENLNSVLNFMNYTFFKEKKQTFISYSKKGELAINNVVNIKELLKGLDYQTDTLYLNTKKTILQTATYELQMTFPKRVKKSRNYRFVLSDDRKTLSLRFPLEKIINSQTRVGNRIKFK